MALQPDKLVAIERANHVAFTCHYRLLSFQVYSWAELVLQQRNTTSWLLYQQELVCFVIYNPMGDSYCVNKTRIPYSASVYLALHMPLIKCCLNTTHWPRTSRGFQQSPTEFFLETPIPSTIPLRCPRDLAL